MEQPPPLPRQAKFGDNAVERMIPPVGRSGGAIAAGYLGLFCILVVPAPICLIVSIVAIWDIRRSKNWVSVSRSPSGVWHHK